MTHQPNLPVKNLSRTNVDEEEIGKSLNSPKKIVSHISIGRLPSFNNLTQNALRYGIMSIQGIRETQEDSHSAIKRNEYQGEEIPFSFFGVYDGHGGQVAAEYVAEHLFKIFLEKSKRSSDSVTCIKEAFAQVETDFLVKSAQDSVFDGTTACVAVIKDNKLIIANVGDSELVLSRNGKAHVLTEVHNPKRNKKEAERVEKVGGKIYHERVGHPKIAPHICSLAVSRAIGDAFFKLPDFTDGKQSGIIAEPFVQEVVVNETDQFCILACDGVWDVMPYQEAVDYVHTLLKETDDPQHVADQLTQRALNKGSTDNITALIVTFKNFK